MPTASALSLRVPAFPLPWVRKVTHFLRVDCFVAKPEKSKTLFIGSKKVKSVGDSVGIWLADLTSVELPMRC